MNAKILIADDPQDFMETPLPPALHFLRICNWLFLHCL